MNCEEYLPLISGHIDGANSEIEERRLQSHLNTCESCRALLAQTEQNDALLRSSVATPPPDLTARILREVRSEKQSPRKKRWIPIAASGLAAAALLSLVIWGKLPLMPVASKDAAIIEEPKTESVTLSAAQQKFSENGLSYSDTAAEVPADTESIAEYDTDLALPEYGAFPAETAAGTTEKRNPTRYTPSAPMMIIWNAEELDALTGLDVIAPDESTPLTATPVPSLYARFRAIVPLIRDFDLISPDDGYVLKVYTVPYETMMAAFSESAGVYENAIYYPAGFTTPDECSVVLINFE